MASTQGTTGTDTDVPSSMEAWLITTSSTSALDHSARKTCFVCFHTLAYACRPMLLKPELLLRDRWLVLNCTAQLAFNAVLVYAFGAAGLLYPLLSTFAAGSLHPMAGHFIAEHYVTAFPNAVPAETYSYYGCLNYLAYNVGYHNEHHDFPNIPWSGLPRVRALAPEFYNTLPQCQSWPGTLLHFILDDAMSPMSRVVRDATGKQD